jgi:Ca2+-binding RTX toxin-like protein
MSGSTLAVEGTSGPDGIYVRTVGSQVSVDGVRINVGGVLRTSVPLSSVAKVYVNALGGNDVVSTHVRDGNTKPADVWGGSGNDTLYGSRGNDQLVGESGHDTLYGNQGNDRLYGGTGFDSLYGFTGDDFLSGGSAASGGGTAGELDRLYGEAGFDTYADAFDLARPVYQGLSYFDVQQRESPTCQTLAVLAGAVRAGNNLAGNIRVTGTGTYTVKVYSGGQSHLQPVNFNGVWNDNDPSPALDGAGRVLPEFWTILYQRARMNWLGVDTSRALSKAQWDAHQQRTGGQLYSSDHAGRLFTGRSVAVRSAAATSTSVIYNAITSGKMVIASTPGTDKKVIDPATGLIASHCYAVLGYTSTGSIYLYNPWGQDTDGPPRDGKQDGVITVTRAQFNLYFNGVLVI